MATCPNCNGEVKDTAKFCKHCGNKIEQKPQFVFCEECGAKIEANAPFCEECGAKIGDTQADDPWGEFDKPKNDDPWASFADYKEPETIVVEKVVEKPVVVEQSKPVSSTMEQDYQQGLKILKRCSAEKKMLLAIDLIMPKAKTGDKEAMRAVAKAYKTIGKYDKAFEWYEKAGDKSETEDCAYEIAVKQINSGTIWKKSETGFKSYDYSYDIPALKKGIEMMRPFAEKNYRNAVTCIANAYENIGDNANAYKWIKRGVDAGNNVAQYFLSDGYKRGKYGLPVDRNKAYQWLKTAADNGNSFAKIDLDYWDK